MSRIIINNAVVFTGYRKIQNGGIIIENSKITDVFEGGEELVDYNSTDVLINANGSYLTPGLIDTHIHGIGGYGTEDATEESIIGMSESLVKYGVTGFFPTLYPSEKNKMLQTVSNIVSASKKTKGSRVLGVHLEGPFISKVKKGALPEEYILDADTEYFSQLISKCGDLKLCMTISPEIKNLKEIVKIASEKKVKLLCGHTNATYEEAIRGFDLDIKHVTHFFNAMSALNHRAPGVVGAVLSRSDVSIEIIADGVHVNKDLVKFVSNLKGPDKMVLITDSLKPTGVSEGKLYANGVEVVLSKSGVFVSKDNMDLINGSALTLNKAVRNVSEWITDTNLAVRYATSNPSEIYNLNCGKLIPNVYADVVLFNSDFEVKKVFVKGKEIV